MTSPITPAAPDVTSLDRSQENVTATLYRDAIGPINADYYLPVFTRFEAAGRAGPSWNWAASLYTLNWMIFRHLWAAAGVYLTVMLGLLLVVLGIGRLMFQWSEEAQLAWLLLCGGLSVVLPGLFGNAIFYARSRQQMTAALTASPTLVDACHRLNQQASTRQRFVWLVALNLALLASLAALAYVAWPVATVQPIGPVTQPVTGSLPQSVPMDASPASDLVQVPTPAPEPTSASASAPTPVPATTTIVDPILNLILTPSLSLPLPTRSMAAAPPVPLDASASVPSGGKPRVTPAAKIAPPTAMALPQGAASSPVTGQSYLINVGLFAVASNARNAKEKLQVAGLPVLTQALKGRTRVRVGPFTSESEARAAAEQIQALQLEAVVFQP